MQKKIYLYFNVIERFQQHLKNSDRIDSFDFRNFLIFKVANLNALALNKKVKINQVK